MHNYVRKRGLNLQKWLDININIDTIRAMANIEDILAMFDSQI